MTDSVPGSIIALLWTAAGIAASLTVIHGLLAGVSVDHTPVLSVMHCILGCVSSLPVCVHLSLLGYLSSESVINQRTVDTAHQWGNLAVLAWLSSVPVILLSALAQIICLVRWIDQIAPNPSQSQSKWSREWAPMVPAWATLLSAVGLVVSYLVWDEQHEHEPEPFLSGYASVRGLFAFDSLMLALSVLGCLLFNLVTEYWSPTFLPISLTLAGIPCVYLSAAPPQTDHLLSFSVAFAALLTLLQIGQLAWMLYLRSWLRSRVNRIDQFRLDLHVANAHTSAVLRRANFERTDDCLFTYSSDGWSTFDGI